MKIRIIWLMMLIIIAVSAWFLDARILTYISGLAFVMSVMQYVDAIQDPLQDIAQQTLFPLQSTSKVPLYISSIVAVVGLTLHLSWMVGLGLTAWIFLFLTLVTPFRALFNSSTITNSTFELFRTYIPRFKPSAID